MTVGRPQTYDVRMTATQERLPLSRERIIGAAVVYADRHGVESLSMRRLGAELGVEAMSLYNHVSNKDEILDGMIDDVLGQIPIPDPGSGWRAAIRSTATNALDVFATHPWLVVLLMQRGTYGDSSLAFMDRMLGLLHEAGFSAEDTHHSWQMLAGHVLGYAFHHASGDPEATDWRERAEQLSRLDDRFPNVAKIVPYLAKCDFRTEFDFGLDIILDGLEAHLGRHPG